MKKAVFLSAVLFYVFTTGGLFLWSLFELVTFLFRGSKVDTSILATFFVLFTLGIVGAFIGSQRYRKAVKEYNETDRFK